MSAPSRATSFDRLFAALLWLLPTRLLSHGVGALARARIGWLRRGLIGGFRRAYPGIAMREAAEPDPQRYASFEAFFTRALAPGARPLPEDAEAIVSPVDGTLGAFGDAHAGTLCQSKGVAYDLRALLGGDAHAAAAFLGGGYATFYLAPTDYHRVHMPIDGRIASARYLPGRLFGVNPRCVRAVPRLFTRNERLVTRFDTATGPMALVMVGAFIVGGIHTRWTGAVCPPHRRAVREQRFADAGADAQCARGAEMGHFSIGSSVILLFGPGRIIWRPGLANGQPLRVGQAIADRQTRR